MKKYRDIPGDGGSNVLAQVGAQRERLTARLRSVAHILAVASGKGGVGKSSLTVHLASALALRGAKVGIVDADLNGSSIPIMTGVRGRSLAPGGNGMVPPQGALGVRVVSIDLLRSDDRDFVRWKAPTQADAFTWRGMMEVGSIREFLSDTDWGDPEYLLVDLPPGSDRISNLAGVLPRLSAAILVTLPSAVSRLAVGKSIRLAREVLDPSRIALVENMSSHDCPACGHPVPLFPDGPVRDWASAEGVAYLGAVPFDPRIAEANDRGIPFLTEYPQAPAALAIRGIAETLAGFLQGDVS